MSKKTTAEASKFLPDARANISRRDFVGGLLIGSGAALLSGAAPLYAGNKQQARGKKLAGFYSDPWTGFGGVGDYARSNGNVASTREAAHLIRYGYARQLSEAAVDTGEEYDMVIVGGGFSSMGAAYNFYQQYGDSRRCLIIDNHPIFGGEAKQNEFDVQGYRLYGPQGSNGFSPPSGNGGLSDEIFRTVGMPMTYTFAGEDSAKTRVRTPTDSYYSMYWGERQYDVGYFFADAGKGKDWIVNPWDDNLLRTPWSPEDRASLVRAYTDKTQYYQGDDFKRWLDSMSYKAYLEKEMGLSPKVAEFLDPIIAVSDFGLSCDVISAYAASLLALPGTTPAKTPSAEQIASDQPGSSATVDLSKPPAHAPFSFPGGNTGYYRHILKYMLPEAIKGGHSFEEILNNQVNFAALDRPQNPLSLRLNSTVINVRHQGPADSADYVDVTYYKQGKSYRVKAKSVVMAVGGWVARNIVSDMPEPILQAYGEFHHGPVLVVNVALNNWKFLDRLGISSARWFDGFGTFCSIRRPMQVGHSMEPYDPEKPTVMTFYVPFNFPGHNIRDQGSLGRHELLSKTYAQYETEILMQMTRMFAAAGFDARRDVAGLVLNRWGHAYVAPQPGFYFGQNGAAAPKEVVKQGFGRIQFGHSELGSRMNYRNALSEGGRAATSVSSRL